MQLVFQSSASFENDLALLGEQVRNAVIEKINTVCPGILCSREEFCSLLTRPDDLKLNNGCCPSLSILQTDYGYAVILAIDEDPIFDQLIVSLFRAVPLTESVAAYQEAVRVMYCGMLETGDQSSP